MELKRNKILFVIADLDGYGAQRVVLNLISNIDRKQFDPVLVLSSRKGIYMEEVPEDVRLYDLGRKSAYDFPKLVLKLAKIIFKERPGLVFSVLFHANILTLLAKYLSLSSPKIIISEHVSQTGYRYANQGHFSRWLMSKLYPKAHLIIGVSNGVGSDMMESFQIPPDKIKIIYNPVNTEMIKKLAIEGIDDPIWDHYPLIVNIGRLDIQKGHSYLLKAFSIVRGKIPSKLMIIGDGDDRKKLEKLAKELGIEKDIIFEGYRKNPYKYLSRSSVFANSSLYEGFGYTIVEAMLLGVPVIATSCPHGPDEIIKDGENGLLVPVADVEAMAKAIMRVLEDKELRCRLSLSGKIRAEDFSVNRIIKEYEEVFRTAIEA